MATKKKAAPTGSQKRNAAGPAKAAKTAKATKTTTTASSVKAGRTTSPPRRNPFAMLTRLAPQQVSSFTTLLTKEGNAPEVGTVVYVHGIGNKPVASILKCQWDNALFGAAMGDRTRLAYWVNRNRYPEPEAGTCADKDTPAGAPSGPGGLGAQQPLQRP